ncbi:MAG: glycerol-1-phosphate dehydrogenase, partial [Nitrososphaera sp.]
MDSPPTHLMELPRKILIGESVISELGSLVRALGPESSKVAIITGKKVKARAGNKCAQSLEKESIDFSWHVVS